MLPYSLSITIQQQANEHSDCFNTNVPRMRISDIGSYLRLNFILFTFILNKRISQPVTLINMGSIDECFPPMTANVHTSVFVSLYFWYQFPKTHPRYLSLLSFSTVLPGRLGFDSRQGQEISFFFTEFRPALAAHPASYPMGTVTLSPEESRRSVKLITHFRLLSRERMMELYLHSLIRLHGVVFN
jgi:hypothetical protein